MTHRCTYIHRNRACVHVCWHTEQTNCRAAVIGGCETLSDCTESSHFWLRALGSAAGSQGGGRGGMSGCNMDRGRGVLLLRSCVLETEKKAVSCPHLVQVALGPLGVWGEGNESGKSTTGPELRAWLSCFSFGVTLPPWPPCLGWVFTAELTRL